MSYVFLQQNVRRGVAAALAVWLSGAVFLFCCETSKAKIADEESCPLSKTSHCGKKAADAAVLDFEVLQTDGNNFDCCRFPAQVFDKARKIETNQQTAEIVPIVKFSTAKFAAVRTTFEYPKFYQSFVRNRGSTHLQNCVFRI